MLYITLRQLEYVVAIARAGSLSEAALTLNVSQPSLSVALAQVEERLGAKLFLRRKGMAIALAPQASAFLAGAEDVLRRAARLEDPAAFAAIRIERIAIGCFADLAPKFLAPVMRAVRAAAPDLEIRPMVADFETLADEMLRGRLDFSITYDLGLDGSFERRPLGAATAHAFIAADDPFAGARSLRLADLAERPLILFSEGLSIHHMLGLFRAEKLRPRVAHRVASLEVMRSLAANGEGVGVGYTAPPSSVSYDGAPVLAVPIIDPRATEPIILARSRLVTPSQAVRAAISAVEGGGAFS
ncbi:LysR family transcriptional regulator [Pikeienuella sp. HZG-20]|uniref:LysR family transcriptional regulator n=1 Tax=Paludibacillus litoralis TaxID=3133267 RepID=UPI0030EEC947